MSRFFKSAAFPILIVVVLAFFAQQSEAHESRLDVVSGPGLTREGTLSGRREQDVERDQALPAQDVDDLVESPVFLGGGREQGRLAVSRMADDGDAVRIDQHRRIDQQIVLEPHREDGTCMPGPK